MSRMNDPQLNEGTSGTSGSATGATSAMRDKAQDVAQNLTEMGSHLKDAAVEQYENVRDQASEYYEAGKDKARQWVDDLEGYVREQPIKSLLIAAGAGVLLGIIWKRS